MSWALAEPSLRVHCQLVGKIQGNYHQEQCSLLDFGVVVFACWGGVFFFFLWFVYFGFGLACFLESRNRQ